MKRVALLALLAFGRVALGDEPPAPPPPDAPVSMDGKVFETHSGDVVPASGCWMNAATCILVHNKIVSEGFLAAENEALRADAAKKDAAWVVVAIGVAVAAVAGGAAAGYALGRAHK